MDKDVFSRNKHKRWTREEALDAFRLCDSVSEVIERAGQGCYRFVLENGMIDEFCRHMSKKPDHYNWTDGELIEFAKGARNHSELKSMSTVVYRHMEERGLLDKVLPPKPKRWTLKECKEIAKKYKRRSDFQKHDRNACAACERNGWMDEVCAHMAPVPERIKKRVKAGTWTREMMEASAVNYGSLVEWERGDPKAYYAAFNQRIHTCIATMMGWRFREPMPIGHWKDPLNCMTEARKYKTKAEWCRGSQTSYNAAHKYGFVDICSWHMEDGTQSDYDSLYAWKVTKAKDEVVVPLPGFHLVKFGVTSQTQGDRRIKGVARKNGMEQEVIGHCDVSTDENGKGHALLFEAELKKLGTDPQLPYWYDGKTEFRLISDEELDLIKQLMGVQEDALEQAA